MSNLRFTIKAAPVLVEHRPLYKISQLLMVLHISSRGSKSSLARLQLFNWALKRDDRATLLEDAANTGQLNVSGWGFDPAVPIALRFAIADGLIVDVAVGYALTTDGEAFVRAVILAGLLQSEFGMLQKLSKKITETMVTNVARSWEA